MAEVIELEVHDVRRGDVFKVIPLGDIHIGAAACDEELLASVVKRIASDDKTFWIGMGDYCEFINLRDWRFDVSELAPWIKTQDLSDMARTQRNRFLNHIDSIADKCWGLIKGNHEHEIHRHTERAIYDEIVSKVKRMGKFPSDRKIGLGYYGWIKSLFLRSAKEEKRNTRSSVTFNVHHGFVGGRLKGAKGLNMERWLWNHECDIALFGHSHNADIFTAAIERVNSKGNIENVIRRGAYGGTFRTTVIEGHSTYSERKGYFPLPILGCEVLLRPGAENRRDRIRISV